MELNSERGGRELIEVKLSIDKQLYARFKEKAKQQGLRANLVVEALMKLYLMPGMKSCPIRRGIYEETD